MSPQHESALNEIKARATGAEAGASANAWRHAVLVVAQFAKPSRAVKQLQMHAGYTSLPEKKAAYLKAAKIVSELTATPEFELEPA